MSAPLKRLYGNFDSSQKRKPPKATPMAMVISKMTPMKKNVFKKTGVATRDAALEIQVGQVDVG